MLKKMQVDSRNLTKTTLPVKENFSSHNNIKLKIL